MKKTLIFSIVQFCAGLVLFVVALGLISDGGTYGPAILLLIGVIMFGLCWHNIKQYIAEKNSASFINNADSKYVALVDRVLEAKSTDSIINSSSFYNNNVKMVVMDFNRFWSLVVTKDCIFENHANSYQNPKTGYKNIKFSLGEEWSSSQRQLVDVTKQAEMGFLVGGIGVGAMNAVDAINANAEGGVLVSKKSGYRLQMKASGGNSISSVIIIRNDLLKRHGEPYMFGSVTQGKYYSAYFLSPENKATMIATGKALTDFLETIVFDDSIDEIVINKTPKTPKTSKTPKSKKCASFEQKNFVVAAVSSRKEDSRIRNEIRSRGGTIQSGVTKKTNYLVCPSRKRGVAPRIDTAMDYIEKGVPIKIITIDEFNELIKSIPPIIE